MNTHDNEEPFYGPHFRPTATRDIVWTRSGVGIGSAHVRPPAPMTDEAIRVQRLLFATPRNEQRTAADVWRDCEVAAARDAHVQAMSASPERAQRERVYRIVDRIMFALFLAILLCMCVAGWNAWLPGGGG